MRRVIYSVATSLDGYIAGPEGEYDWIPDEPDVDWGAFLGRFDTVLMGRGTYEIMEEEVGQNGGADPTSGMRTIVFSTTLDPGEHPAVEIVAGNAAGVVADLREEDGKDVWLMGGGILFRSLLEAGVVDAVEAAVVPILLGEGIPFLPVGEGRAELELTDVEAYPTGIVMLRYDVHG